MIDKATAERIKETANIVDVVSEFVTLRRSGSNFKGLCPFHSEKTPSFYVSPARGTCHCFGCGKGGDSVSFIMEHEQMTYPEALRWLANKYHIEIRERELTDEEKREQSERESMFIVNEWAANYFEDLLHNDVDGIALGMQYFRSRGFRDDIIKKFRLGYDVNDRLRLAEQAKAKGYNTDFLLKTGICYKTEHNEIMDRYVGRVIFPWVGVSGKITGFGGRVLDSRTKGVNQKYVNSPESEIYHKDHELYGIYQAKRAIAKEDHVYMVEGYTDVISMHQCGIENVVANSGTALSIHQIHTLHRFTSNITLLYDGDAAGIHAALRGTDMLLAEGMNLKVLLFPDGDDPDSFARKHTADEFRKYVEDHQTDFIEFKSDVMLRGITDPTKRSQAINSIIQSISMVQDPILRDTYIHDCSHRLNINEVTLINTMNHFISESRNRGMNTHEASAQAPMAQPAQQPMTTQPSPSQQASQVERMLMQMVIRNGEKIVLKDVEDDNGNLINMSVAQYIEYNLSVDDLSFENETFRNMLQEAADQCAANDDFKAEQYFVHHHDINISKIATALSVDKYLVIEKPDANDNLYTEEEKEEEERAKLLREADHLLNDFRLDYLNKQVEQLQNEIKQCSDLNQSLKLIPQLNELKTLRNSFALKVGRA